MAIAPICRKCFNYKTRELTLREKIDFKFHYFYICDKCGWVF